MKPAKREYFQFLIIDDDPGIAKFLVTYLRQQGHTCCALTDGFQTAAWLSENDSEVAIVDLKMPKVDGISLIAFIRELNSTLPIVVFAGVGYNEEQIHAALHAGANGYVSKNLPIEQLLLRAHASPCDVSAAQTQRPFQQSATSARWRCLTQRFSTASKSLRNPSGETQAAPLALTVSISRESEVATVISKREAYLLASRSIIASAD